MAGTRRYGVPADAISVPADSGAASVARWRGWWRGGATAGRRTCDQEVVSSIPGRGAAAYDDSGQVVHTHVPRQPGSGVVEPAGTFTFI